MHSIFHVVIGTRWEVGHRWPMGGPMLNGLTTGEVGLKLVEAGRLAEADGMTKHRPCRRDQIVERELLHLYPGLSCMYICTYE